MGLCQKVSSLSDASRNKKFKLLCFALGIVIIACTFCSCGFFGKQEPRLGDNKAVFDKYYGTPIAKPMSQALGGYDYYYGKNIKVQFENKNNQAAFIQILGDKNLIKNMLPKDAKLVKEKSGRSPIGNRKTITQWFRSEKLFKTASSPRTDYNISTTVIQVNNNQSLCSIQWF